MIGYFMLLCVLAFVSLPSLHGYYACMVNWDEGALRGNNRQHFRKTFFPGRVFSA